MSENLTDIRKKLDAIDQKIISALATRIEIMPYIAEAKYLTEGENVVIKSPQREGEILQKIIYQANSLAIGKSLENPDEFVALVSKLFKEIMDFSCEEQEKYLKKEFNITN